MATFGMPEMLNHAFNVHTHLQSPHFICGFLELAPGTPYIGPLTPWTEATFAQHRCLGAPNDAYSLEVLSARWFEKPAQVFMRLSRSGEKRIQLRPKSMVFFPSALQMLLKQRLVVAPQCENTAAYALSRHGISPDDIVAIQVAAPLVEQLQKERLKHLVLRASWPAVNAGFPHAWFGKVMLHEPTAAAGPEWESMQSVLTTVRQCFHQSPDLHDRNDIAQAVSYLEEAW